MRIFMTGASGWIGSAATQALLGAGHEVVGLARSDRAADSIAALGADVVRGDLTDLDALRAAATASDGVVHLAYDHDFSDMPRAASIDRTVITAMGDALVGSGKLLLIAAGVLGLTSDSGTATEADGHRSGAHPRTSNASVALDYAARGVRSCVVRFAPTVHGAGDHGFVAYLAAVARQRGSSAYIGDGSNCWPAVHVSDAADLVRRGVERATPGSVLHATAEEGVPTRAIAEALGADLALPVRSIAAEQATDHFGWMTFAFGAPGTAVSSELTRRALGWTPTGPTLLDDIAAGHYHV